MAMQRERGFFGRGGRFKCSRLTGHSVGQEAAAYRYLIGCQHLGGVAHVRSELRADGKHCSVSAERMLHTLVHVTRCEQKHLLMS